MIAHRLSTVQRCDRVTRLVNGRIQAQGPPDQVLIKNIQPRHCSDMEILVLGASLPFQRPKYGICRDKTWPYLLSKQLGCGLQMRAKGGATIIDVANELRFLNSYWFEGLMARSFDITFVQAGIVDCCPRLVPWRLYGWGLAPGFRNLERSPRAHRLLARP